MAMFHAEYLFDERDLAKVHYHVAAIRSFNVSIRPATNVKPDKRGKAKAEIDGSATVSERVAALIRSEYAVGVVIARQAIFEMIESLGNRPNSILVAQLVKAKVIRKKGRGSYVVLKAK